MGKTKALIITDGSETINSIANSIKDALKEVKVKIVDAKNFEGNEILPVDYFILGCEKPSPSSFAYLEELLSHINLVSRKCCIFSVNENSISYLKGIAADCEAEIKEPYLIEKGNFDKSKIKNWI